MCLSIWLIIFIYPLLDSAEQHRNFPFGAFPNPVLRWLPLIALWRVAEALFPGALVLHVALWGSIVTLYPQVQQYASRSAQSLLLFSFQLLLLLLRFLFLLFLFLLLLLLVLLLVCFSFPLPTLPSTLQPLRTASHDQFFVALDDCIQFVLIGRCFHCQMIKCFLIFVEESIGGYSIHSGCCICRHSRVCRFGFFALLSIPKILSEEILSIVPRTVACVLDSPLFLSSAD